MTTHDCLLCSALEDTPQTFRIYDDETWSAGMIPGVASIVVQTRRHVEGIWNLGPDETASMGGVIARVARALRDALKAERLYVVGMGENHPHFHLMLVARPPGLPIDQRGTRLIDSQLGVNEGSPASSVRRSGILESLREELMGSAP